MSARDAWQAVLDSLMGTIGAYDDDGPTQLIEEMHNNVMALPDAERIALARALLPAGWVVAKVPDRATPGTVPWRYGDEWAGVQDGASEESLDLICNGYADGWNACRAAFIKSGEETP